MLTNLLLLLLLLLGLHLLQPYTLHTLPQRDDVQVVGLQVAILLHLSPSSAH
jgi:hypothetical protein